MDKFGKMKFMLCNFYGHVCIRQKTREITNLHKSSFEPVEDGCFAKKDVVLVYNKCILSHLTSVIHNRNKYHGF